MNARKQSEHIKAAESTQNNNLVKVKDSLKCAKAVISEDKTYHYLPLATLGDGAINRNEIVVVEEKSRAYVSGQIMPESYTPYVIRDAVNFRNLLLHKSTPRVDYNWAKITSEYLRVRDADFLYNQQNEVYERYCMQDRLDIDYLVDK